VTKKSTIKEPIEDVIKNSAAQKRREIKPMEDALSFEEYVELLKLPTQEDYPYAPEKLFRPEEAVNVLASYTHRLGLHLSFKFRKLASMPRGDYHQDARAGKIFLTMGGNEMEGFGMWTAVGVGLGESGIKRAAMTQMLAKFHAKGVLKKIFGEANQPNRAIVYNEERTDFVALDMSTINSSTHLDATIDIYNFAASFGEVPVFAAAKMAPSFRKVLFAKSIIRGVSNWKVDVKLPGLDFLVSAIDKDAGQAQTAALLTLKRRIEDHADRLGELRKTIPDWSDLTVDTAADFITFLRAAKPSMKVELDSPGGKRGVGKENPIEIVLNGMKLEALVYGPTKKDSMAFGRLVAAIHILKQHPELYAEFTEALSKGGGKIIRLQAPLYTPVSRNSLQIMNKALKESGSPQSHGINRQALPTANIENVETRAYRTQPEPGKRQALNERLLRQQEIFNNDPATAQMRDIRANLPMSQHSATVLDMIKNNTYSIVVGATGSGKTTQVPQLILDDAIASGSGGFCDIICTQPRRIAATSVAQRVAEERGQQLQEQIGHHVRFDPKLAPLGGSINFCTTGILLTVLRHHPDSLFDGVSHIVLDEVHERDMTMDILLINIKRAMENRARLGKSNPKVILMSATLDTKLFADFFAQRKEGVLTPCPSVSVPGRTFPVTENYLTTIIGDLEKEHNAEYKSLLADDKKNIDYLNAERQLDLARKSSPDAKDEAVIEWKRRVKTGDREEDEDGDNAMPKDPLENHVPVGLVAATIARVVETSTDGAVLVFLPGLDEIKNTDKLLRSRPIFGMNFKDPSKFDIHVLHSSVPPADQKRIFDPIAPGTRKIILATNIAETSITVPDVKHVIDAGKLREKRYDAVKRITKLECVWESQSNAKQRAGRAGRVSDGNYYALYSRGRKALMRAAGKPELLRSDLAEVCLSIKAQGFQEPLAQFLSRAIEPPSMSALRSSIKYLKSMSAFTDGEELTVLGEVLAKMPVHPSLGKMILLGIIFRCLDPMLLLGSQEPGRTLFTFPPGSNKRSVMAGHEKFKRDSSDHIAQLRAMDKIRSLASRGMYDRQLFDYAQSENLHFGAYRDATRTAAQIDGILQEIKLIPKRFGPGLYGGEDLNTNATNLELLKCLVLAGNYPNLAVKHTRRLLRTAVEDTLIMPSQSTNANTDEPTGTLYAFSQLFESSNQMTMRESTLVSPIQAMLFGGKLQYNSFGKLEMDDWLPFGIETASDKRTAQQIILQFRHALDSILHEALMGVLTPGKTQEHRERLRTNFIEHVLSILELEKHIPRPPSSKPEGSGTTRSYSGGDGGASRGGRGVGAGGGRTVRRPGSSSSSFFGSSSSSGGSSGGFVRPGSRSG
jgi:HrpA-like RNA helicase